MGAIQKFLMCLCLCGLVSPIAAQERNGADMMRRMEERMDKQAGQLANEFKLEGESRANFMALYKKYRQDVMKHRLAAMQRPEGNAKKEADMTDEEASARIQADFDRKAQDIVNAYNALETEKKYYEEFSKTLSPKQLMKIFAPVRNPRGARNMQPRGGRNGMPMGGQGFGGMQDGFGGGNDW